MTSQLRGRKRHPFPTRYFALFVFTSLLAIQAVAKELPKKLYSEGARILGGHANVVSSRTHPVRLSVIGDTVATEMAKQVTREATSIAALEFSLLSRPTKSGVPAADVVKSFARCIETESIDVPDCPNLLVLVSDTATARGLLPFLSLRQVYRDALASEEIICFFAPFETGRKRIRAAFVYVESGLGEAMQRTCLQEEIWQSFGLYNDVGESRLFSFNNVVAPKRLTKYDRGLLKALYDPRVKSGYPVGLVMEIFIKQMAAEADQ